MKPFRIFVAGTDTGVGKTQAAAALLSLLADAGRKPAPFKPYESGVKRLAAPADASALKLAARSEDHLLLVCPHRFEAPLAPGIAAEREGREPSIRKTIGAFALFRGRDVVVEGAGGLRVPIDSKLEVIDLITTLSLPVLLVARAGLGTINHTVLSLDALKARGIRVEGVLLVRSQERRDPSERDNGRVLHERYGVRVLGPVPFVADERKRRAAFRKALRPLVT